MTPRLFHPGPIVPGTALAIPREQEHYLLRVLRLAAGDPVQLFDGRGGRFEAVLEASGARVWALQVRGAVDPLPESPLRVTLAQCLSTGDKMDWTLEKAVELGVATIQPLQSRRATVRLDEARARKRHEHWQRLILAACAQCGRDTVPELHPVIGLPQWLAARPPQRPGVVMDPGASQALARGPWQAGELDLLVGPESGLAPDEIELALQAGLERRTLGPRVLRTETAGLAALTLLQALAGDLR